MSELRFTMHLKTVDCPGVWLCSKGNVLLRLSAFDTSKNTRKIHAKFPLNYNEHFQFCKFIIGGMRLLIQLLQSDCLQIDLVQFSCNDSTCGIVLAKFSQKFYYLFKPFIIDDRVVIQAEVELLMQRTKYFPGIISPKICAKLQLKMQPCQNQMKNDSISASNLVFQCSARQQSVCHCNTKHTFMKRLSLNCSCSSDRINDQRNSQLMDRTREYLFCHWCNQDEDSCLCCICWKYHSKFHQV